MLREVAMTEKSCSESQKLLKSCRAQSVNAYSLRADRADHRIIRYYY